MEAVIKVGGSLAESPEALKALCIKLGQLVKKHGIVIVPGGGKFADVVRDFDRQFALASIVSHKMAVLGMDQFGLFLSHLIPCAVTFCQLENARSILEAKRAPIFLPSKLMFQDDPLENSWNVTSDSISAFVASRLHAAKLVLLTDVDGVFTKDPKKYPNAKLIRQLLAKTLVNRVRRTSIDKFLPRLLLETQLDCYVANGKNPERIEAILAGLQTVCTRIAAKPSKPF